MTSVQESYALGWPEVSDLWTALVCAVACAVLGWFAPRLIARLPEPEPPEDPEADSEKSEQDAVNGRSGDARWSPCARSPRRRGA